MGSRILFFLSGFWTGGAERQTIDLARLLDARGYDCDFLAFHRTGGAAPDDPLLARAAYVEGRGRMLDPRSILPVLGMIAERKPDILVCVNPTTTIVGALGRMSGHLAFPVVSTFHTTISPSRKVSLQIRLMRATLRGVDAFVFVSERQRDYWRDRGLRPRRSVVVHNGVDLLHFAPPADPGLGRRIREEIGFGPEDHVIGLLGTFRPEKHHQQLVDAVVDLRSRGVTAKALFVGAGPTMAEVAAHAERRGVSHHVTFAGEHRDVRPLVAAMDVGVLCSVAVETLSLAALEIMSMGVPMVMSDIGGASEIVEDGVNGFLFPAGDTPALVAALLRLSDPGLRRRFGGEALATVGRKFSNQVMADRYEALFRDLGRRAS